jgi:hypothetical protein
MDAETKTILRQLHRAVTELSKIAKTTYQTAHPTFNETTIKNLMAPIDASLAEIEKHLGQPD